MNDVALCAQVLVSPPSRPDRVKVEGPGITHALLTRPPTATWFSVDCSEAGAGALDVKLFNENGRQMLFASVEKDTRAVNCGAVTAKEPAVGVNTYTYAPSTEQLSDEALEWSVHISYGTQMPPQPRKYRIRMMLGSTKGARHIHSQVSYSNISLEKLSRRTRTVCLTWRLLRCSRKL